MAELERAKTEPVDMRELERVWNQDEAELVRAMGSNMGLAFRVGFYAAMRGDGVQYLEANDAYVVLRHEDALTVLRDPHTYSSRLGSNREQPPPEVREEIAEINARGLPRPRTLLDNDPPDHARYRRLVARAFTPRKMAQLRPFVESLADGLIDARTGGATHVMFESDGPEVRVLPVTPDEPGQDTAT